MQGTMCSAGTVSSRQAALGEALASRGTGSERRRRQPSSRLRLDAATLLAHGTDSSRARVDIVVGKSRPAAKHDVGELATLLRTLAHRSNFAKAELLEALARFDDVEGWRAHGAKSCVHWMCSELGLGRSLAYEKLRVARVLGGLPLIAELFRDGELSWSKAQALTRVATAEDERALAIMALDNDANVVQQYCDEYRWGKQHSSAAEDGAVDKERFDQRSLTWSRLPNGSLAFRTVLPPDMAANFIACLEHQESLIFKSSRADTADSASDMDTHSTVNASSASGDNLTDAAPETPPHTAAQRRADALVAMAEISLGAGGEGLSSADRFQVVVHVDAEALETAETEAEAEAETVAAVAHSTKGADSGDAEALETARGNFRDAGAAASASLKGPSCGRKHSTDSSISVDDSESLSLPVRAAIAGIGGISPSTARRLACDGSLVTMIVKNGEPIALGRKTRQWSPAIRRAILARDGGCRFPGCGARHNLDVHHVRNWAFGGQTSVDGGITLCRSCHTRVHDERWRIVRTPNDAPRQRHRCAAALLQDADERTLTMTAKLDARRTVFHFERSDGMSAGELSSDGATQ